MRPGPLVTPQRHRLPGRSSSRTLVTLVLALTVLALLRLVVLEPRRVASSSMEPTLHRGSLVLVDKLTPRFRGPQRGDVVVFASPQDGHDAIKRVVAVGGDDVAIRDAQLFVDGHLVDEPQIDHSRIDGVWFGPVKVPPRTVFVLGDSRSGSIDSRVFGPVPVDAVSGRVAGR